MAGRSMEARKKVREAVGRKETFEATVKDKRRRPVDGFNPEKLSDQDLAALIAIYQKGLPGK